MDAAQQQQQQRRHQKEQRQRFYNYQAHPSQPQPVYDGGTYDNKNSNNSSDDNNDSPLRGSNNNNPYYKSDYGSSENKEYKKPPYPVSGIVSGIDMAHLRSMQQGQQQQFYSDHPDAPSSRPGYAPPYPLHDYRAPEGHDYRAPSVHDVEAQGLGQAQMNDSKKTSYDDTYGQQDQYTSGLQDGRRNQDDDKSAPLYEIDQDLKSRIRTLRLITRLLALLIATLVFTPLLLTLLKYLSTRSTTRVVSSSPRTPWARTPVLWPTYAYFALATLTLLLALATMLTHFSYKFRPAQPATYARANRLARWTSGVSATMTILWLVAAIVYRTEKKDADLWGWACSSGAAAIQDEFVAEVDFGWYCRAQSWSWYAGMAQVVCAGVTCVVFVLVLRRVRLKKALGEVERVALLARMRGSEGEGKVVEPEKRKK